MHVAQAALQDHQYVSPIDILVGIRLVAATNVEAWRKGRLDVLERLIQGSPEKILLEGKQKRIAEKVSSAAELVVFIVVRDSKCSECEAEIPEGSMLIMEAGQPLCLPCARLDDLEYLPAGDTALTRRATKYSERRAVVVRFSRSRGRHERQGVLVETAALEKAEQECSMDAGERAEAGARRSAPQEGGPRARRRDD